MSALEPVALSEPLLRKALHDTLVISCGEVLGEGLSTLLLGQDPYPGLIDGAKLSAFAFQHNANELAGEAGQELLKDFLKSAVKKAFLLGLARVAPEIAKKAAELFESTWAVGLPILLDGTNTGNDALFQPGHPHNSVTLPPTFVHSGDGSSLSTPPGQGTPSHTPPPSSPLPLPPPPPPPSGVTKPDPVKEPDTKGTRDSGDGEYPDTPGPIPLTDNASTLDAGSNEPIGSSGGSSGPGGGGPHSLEPREEWEVVEHKVGLPLSPDGHFISRFDSDGADGASADTGSFGSGQGQPPFDPATDMPKMVPYQAPRPGLLTETAGIHFASLETAPNGPAAALATDLPVGLGEFKNYLVQGLHASYPAQADLMCAILFGDAQTPGLLSGPALGESLRRLNATAISASLAVALLKQTIEDYVAEALTTNVPELVAATGQPATGLVEAVLARLPTLLTDFMPYSVPQAPPGPVHRAPLPAPNWSGHPGPVNIIP